MKAISTRYSGATDNRGPRIIASDMDGKRLAVSIPENIHNDYNIHRYAAEEFMWKFRWPECGMIGGSVKGGMVWVMTPRHSPKA